MPSKAERTTSTGAAEMTWKGNFFPANPCEKTLASSATFFLSRTRFPAAMRCSRRTPRNSGSCRSRYVNSAPCCTRCVLESPATF